MDVMRGEMVEAELNRLIEKLRGLLGEGVYS